jgi:hypothetical protein
MAKSKPIEDGDLPQKTKQQLRNERARARLREGKPTPADMDVPTVAREAKEAEIASVQDWAAAENSRPDLPGESPDGLSPTEVEVQRKAGDVPLRPRRPE